MPSCARPRQGAIEWRVACSRGGGRCAFGCAAAPGGRFERTATSDAYGDATSAGGARTALEDWLANIVRNRRRLCLSEARSLRRASSRKYLSGVARRTRPGTLLQIDRVAGVLSLPPAAVSGMVREISLRAPAPLPFGSIVNVRDTPFASERP
jgi:hypothetical protein